MTAEMDEDRRPEDATARGDADASLEASRKRMIKEMVLFRDACDRAASNGRTRLVYNVMAGHWCDHADGKCSRFEEIIVQIARNELDGHRAHRVSMIRSNCVCPRTRCRSLVIEVEAEIERDDLHEGRNQQRSTCGHCAVA